MYLNPYIVNQIKAILIPLSNTDGEFIWVPGANGKFLVKSATWLQCTKIDVKNNNIAAMEFVIRDDHGSSLFAGTKNLGWTNVLSIEPFAR